MGKRDLRRALLLKCAAMAVMCAAAVVTKVTAAEQRWGAYILAITGDGSSYSLAWNYPDPPSALAAALKECSKSAGMSCTPRRLLPSDWWFPDRIHLFSTSAPAGEGTAIDPDYFYMYRARCILLYDIPNYRYATEYRNSEEELRRYFERENQRRFEHYKNPDPLVFHRVICNDS